MATRADRWTYVGTEMDSPSDCSSELSLQYSSSPFEVQKSQVKSVQLGLTCMSLKRMTLNDPPVPLMMTLGHIGLKTMIVSLKNKKEH